MTPAERIAGRRVIVSLSGGRDSAAVSLHLRELGIEHERVFADTGWEHPTTYEHLRGELTEKLGPITEVRAQRLFPELVRHKRTFPSRVMRYCTEELKQKPIKAHFDSIDDGVVSVLGIRRDESKARASMVEWSESDAMDALVWCPILDWTPADVLAIHKRHGVRLNPLYAMGAPRVGCWPCIHAGKAELRLLAEADPARVDEIAALEAEVTELSRQRAAEKGREPGHDRTMFSTVAKTDRINASGRAVRAYVPLPIRDAATWSRTDRGGRQLLLEGDFGGCARFGFCEPKPCDASVPLPTFPAYPADQTDIENTA